MPRKGNRRMSWSTLGGQIQRLLADMARFIVTPNEASVLGLGKREGLEKHIRAYRNGRDLTAHPRGVMVIDLFGLDADEVRGRFPEVS